MLMPENLVHKHVHAFYIKRGQSKSQVGNPGYIY